MKHVKNALIIVDFQNSFTRGGSLAVPDAESILPKVNELSDAISLTFATQDWHPANHSSFAKNVGVAPFTMVDGEMKWPEHCVADTYGSNFKMGLKVVNIRAIFRKGMDANTESYSGVRDAAGVSYGLGELLISLGIDRVYVCGLALDYCVGATAKDLAAMGLNTSIVSDATKPVDPDYKFMSGNDYIPLVTTAEVLSRVHGVENSP